MEDREIGAKIRQLRLAKGLRMEDLARAADLAQSTLSYIERGSNPSAGTLRRVLDALGMTWSEFFGEDPAQSLTSEDRPIPDADRMPSELAGLARGTWWLDLEPEDRQEIANFIEWKLSQIRKEKQRKERK